MKHIETIDVPQANSLSLVGNLLALAKVRILDKERLSRELPLVAREIDYYRHAARILGFAHFDEGKPEDFELTKLGHQYLDEALTPAQKKKMLFEAVLATEVLQGLLEIHKLDELEKEKIVAFLRERTDLNLTTARRRADTLVSWLHYIRT